MKRPSQTASAFELESQQCQPVHHRGGFLLPVPALPLTSHVTLESHYLLGPHFPYLQRENEARCCPPVCLPLQPVTWLLGDKARGSVGAAQREVGEGSPRSTLSSPTGMLDMPGCTGHFPKKLYKTGHVIAKVLGK